MKRLTDAIRAAGMKPMLWWAPLAADPGRQLLREHPEYLLRDARGKPVKITWWDAQYLCPAFAPVQDYTRALVTKFIGAWGFEGLKLDGQHLNAAPPCHNPAHQHERPAEAFERTPELFRVIQEAAAAADPQAVLELCPCGTAYAFHSMPFMHLAVASDPESSWQIRHKGKTLKALIGPSAPYFGDHVELSDGGDDFASTVGVGGVVGTQFTLPSLGRSERKYHLTPAKEAQFRKWVALYRQQLLSRGEYLGELYDIGFDRPEAHAIRKDGRMHYAFYARQFAGEVELRGLPEGRSCVRDYVEDIALGQVSGPRARLPVKFQRHLLLEATPAPAAGCLERR
jgi:alpha-galactosidase